MLFRLSISFVLWLALPAQAQDVSGFAAVNNLSEMFAGESMTMKTLIVVALASVAIVALRTYINHRNHVSFTLEQLKKKIGKLRTADPNKNIYVGIDGDAAVGKTTLTSSFTENPNLIVIHADFYREENCYFFYNWERLKNDLDRMIAGRQGMIIVIEGWRLFLDICPKDTTKKHPFLEKLKFNLAYKKPYVLNIDFDLRGNVRSDYKTKMVNLRIRHPEGDEDDIVRIALRQLRNYAEVKYDVVFNNKAKYRIPLNHRFDIMP